jgi:hypothetical protein
LGLARPLIVLLAVSAAPASAAPLWLSLSTSGGILEERALGVARDDFQLTLRLGIGIGRHVAVSIGFDGDLERLELAARTGVLVRPFAAGRWSPYLRAEVAIVGATHLGNDWELLGGVGILWRVHRFAALFVEVDAVGRVGAVRSLADHLAAGLAVTAPSFWR